MKLGFKVSAIATATSVSLLTVVVGSTPPAEASLKICNRTDSWINTAIAHVIQGGWRSEGWWGMNPGECKIVYGGSAASREFHFYAYSQSGRVWKGGQGHCVGEQAFTIDFTWDSPRCDIRDFRKLNTVSTKNSTVNIR